MFIASTDNSIATYFEGYAWVGNDLIVGQGGADSYLQQTGSPVPAGEDGCYVVVHRFPEGFVVGTDYRGLSRLFTYEHGDKWAIASSLYELITKIRGLGWPLTLREESVAAFLANFRFSTQISSQGVHFAEVKLVPSFASVLVLGNRISLEFRDSTEIPEYGVALEQFLTTWKNRLSTIASSPDARMKMDLSGGFDSRTVVAFAINNGEILKGGARIESSTKPRSEKDYSAASNIADKYDFELNSKSYPFRSPRLSAKAAYSGWKQHSLGVYSPVYLYNSAVDSNYVHAHGAGGGNFRPHYKSIKGEIANVGATLSKSNFLLWKNRVLQDLTSLSGVSSSKNLEVLYYREFRNRFHFGHRPQQSLVFMPLESKLTDPLTDRVDDRDGRQFYYDVMESLVPGLSLMDYDFEEKVPNNTNKLHLTRVETPEPSSGYIYTKSERVEHQASTREDTLKLWMENAVSRSSSKKVSKVLPKEYIEAVDALVSNWNSNGKLGPANSLGMRGLSHAMSIDFLINPDSKI